MDLKNILDNEDNNNQKITENIQKHKKPIQLKEIEKESSNNIEKTNSNFDIQKLIDEEKNQFIINHGINLNKD